MKSITVNRLKKKNDMILSIDAEKAFDTTQHSIMIKKKKKTPLSKLGIEEKSFNFIKNIYRNLQRTLYLNRSFPVKRRNKARIPSLITLQHHTTNSS